METPTNDIGTPSPMHALYPNAILPENPAKGDTKTVTIENVTMVTLFDGTAWIKVATLS